MKKLLLAGFLLAGIMGANAQTISLTTATPTSTTVGGSSSVRIGTNAGQLLTTGSKNIFIGKSSGYSNLTGVNNVYVGVEAGSGSLGSNNTFTGSNSGGVQPLNVCVTPFCQTTGNFNAFYGSASGGANNGGSNNSFFGASAGSSKNTSGSNNTYIGFSSGNNNNGSGNVFLGSNSGPLSPNSAGNSLSNTLYIDNSSTNTPLIWGDFAADQLKLNGTVGIGAVAAFPTTVGGASVANYKLFVTGGILTDEVRVSLNNGLGTWADYVFAKDYDLKPLSEVEAFIAVNKHLPNVPSAAQVKEEGINIGDMARIQQEKIEELTLYIIAQNKRLEALEAKIKNK